MKRNPNGWTATGATVAGREAGEIAGTVALLTFVGIWLLLPIAMRLGHPMSAGPSVELGTQRGQ
ncbi:hypothetical protein [Mycobacterium sp. DL440]|uniref:hypothetical protein n=1 Tax=Mycobacterium sp. DL440 TaxID=2675523 RepID=UPI00142206CA|nr:hypothetical protein [Mycobacterium sp. DL440]